VSGQSDTGKGTGMEHKNSEIAFDHAIKVGALSAAPYEPHGHGLESWPCSCPWFGFAGDYMYMYSEGGLDYFKHIDTREYIKVRAAL